MKCIVKRNELSSYLCGFGPGVEDLRLDVKDNGLVGGVALSTHFLTKRITVDQKESGALVIAELSKVLAFLKACSGEDVELHQPHNDKGAGALRIQCGSSTISLPPSQEIKSSQALEMATKLVNEASESNWEQFGEADLTAYGVIDTTDLKAIASLGKVVGQDKPYKFTFVSKQSQAVVHTGTQVSGQMFHRIDVADASENNDEIISSQYGPWFPEVLSCLPSGKVEMYAGDGTVLVLNHQDKDCLLVVIDQDADEE